MNRQQGIKTATIYVDASASDVAIDGLLRAARDAFDILDGAPCPVDSPAEWRRDVAARLIATISNVEGR